MTMCQAKYACPNLKRTPEGFDGTQINCASCGYYEFVEGRYFKLADRVVLVSGENAPQKQED